MSTRLKATESQSAVAPDQESPREGFDPAAYFDRWLADLEAIRKDLTAKTQKPVEEKGPETLNESEPGSNCEVTFEGILHFEGHSLENIRSPGGSLVVTSLGVVDADIEVAIAVIEGVVNGNIIATERVILERNAKVMGQITTRSLSVSPGAVFDGDCVLTTAEELPVEASLEEEPEEELKHFVVSA
jgi:cytoskeletal protein CcmA (bactofilin family)